MKPTALVLGSGPIRIGQGIEFDYSCVHCVWALRELGYRAVIVNNNPETVSTDFDTGDALYFEPVTHDDVVRIALHEKADGVVVQFGGQTAINLTASLTKSGIPILGTPSSAIDLAEDRDQFEKLLTSLGIAKPPGRAVNSFTEAKKVVTEIGYPLLVRPSFVLGGRAMEICRDDDEFEAYYKEAEDANPGQPVLVDAYITGTEAEVDVICDGEDTFVPGIIEHIERAGVHSGDSMAVYPPVNLKPEIQQQIVSAACRIARAMGVKGLMNAQFVVANGQAMVLEVNPRASRTVPYISKVTGIPMIKIATRCMVGHSLKSMGYASGLWVRRPGMEQEGMLGCKANGYVLGENADISEWEKLPPAVVYAVKAPVFSFQKLSRVEPSLGPEMKSTGEVLGLDSSYEAALYKAMIASGIVFKSKGQVIISVCDDDKVAATEVAREFVKRGYRIAATPGTHKALTDAGIACERLNKLNEGSPTLLERLFQNEVSLMVNTPGPGQPSNSDAARIRRACIETGVACVTSVDTATALARALSVFEDPQKSECRTITEYVAGIQ